MVALLLALAGFCGLCTAFGSGYGRERPAALSAVVGAAWVPLTRSALLEMRNAPCRWQGALRIYISFNFGYRPLVNTEGKATVLPSVFFAIWVLLRQFDIRPIGNAALAKVIAASRNDCTIRP